MTCWGAEREREGATERSVVGRGLTGVPREFLESLCSERAGFRRSGACDWMWEASQEAQGAGTPVKIRAVVGRDREGAEPEGVD